MQNIEHPDIALAQTYGTDAPFVKAHGHPPRSVDNCSECGENIYEGETYYTLNYRAYCETCVEYARSVAEKEVPE